MADLPTNDKTRGALNNETGGVGAVTPLGYPVRQKAVTKRATVSGWTVMRPLRNRNNANQAVAAPDAKRGANGNSVRSTTDLTIIETSATGDSSKRAGEVENLHDLRSDDGLLEDDEEHSHATQNDNWNGGVHTLQTTNDSAEEPAMNGDGEYKVYKRRWFGLVQLVLLNIIVSWDVGVHSLAQAILILI